MKLHQFNHSSRLHLRQVALSFGIITTLLWLGGCAFRGSTRPFVKIGLVAPFEGAHRHLGYNVIHAVKLAISEHNAQADTFGYSVILVALDDGNDSTMAPRRARELVVDPLIVGVVGHLSKETTRAAQPEYRTAELACVAPLNMPITATSLSPDFASRYRDLANQEPTSQAAAAYAATAKLLDALHSVQDYDLPQCGAVFELLGCE